MTSVRRYVCIPMVFAFLLLASPINERSSADESRTWTSSDRQSSIRASFSSYDPKTKQVELITENGDSISINWKQLSRTDQRYILRARKKLNRSSSSNGSDAKSPRENPSQHFANGMQKKAFGINWTLGIEQALEVAGGRESSQDDRPVMWLRVLGDLEGHM